MDGFPSPTARTRRPGASVRRRAALVLSIGNRNRLRMLDQRFGAIERRLAALGRARTAVSRLGAGSAPPHRARRSSRRSRPRTRSRARNPSLRRRRSPSAIPPDEPAAGIAPTRRNRPRRTQPTAPATPGMSLEERLGTQWAVWVGGIALALGGIFLVRYSIEAGLLGPRVRVAARRAAGARPHRRRRMGAPHRTARRHLRACRARTSRAS